MRTFGDVYDKELRPHLEEFEKQRIALKNKILKVMWICSAILVGIVAVVLLAGWAPPIIFIGLVLLVLIGYFCVSSDIGDYKNAFKREVIGRVVKAIDTELEFNPELCISEHQYMKSRIFLTSPDRYDGEDLVSGMLDKTEVHFSEIHSEYKTETRDSEGRRRTQWHTIFKGVFFIADFNKDFKQDTVVMPDTAEKLFGRLGKMFQKMNLRQEKLVTLEDPEFEKLFAVYADDEVEARYILSPALMQRLIAFRKKTGQIYVSFTGSNVNVAVPTNRDLFEPRIWKTVVDRDLVGEYYEDVEFFAGIVEDLNLNNRIWTKE